MLKKIICLTCILFTAISGCWSLLNKSYIFSRWDSSEIKQKSPHSIRLDYQPQIKRTISMTEDEFHVTFMDRDFSPPIEEDIKLLDHFQPVRTKIFKNTIRSHMFYYFLTSNLMKESVVARCDQNHIIVFKFAYNDLYRFNMICQNHEGNQIDEWIQMRLNVDQNNLYQLTHNSLNIDSPRWK